MVSVRSACGGLITLVCGMSECDRRTSWKEPGPTMAVEPSERKVDLIYNSGTLIVEKCTLQVDDFYYYHGANDANDNPKM